MMKVLYTFLFSSILLNTLHSQTGYDLWLGYDQLENGEVLTSYQSSIQSYFIAEASDTRNIITTELDNALPKLLNQDIQQVFDQKNADVVILPASKLSPDLKKAIETASLKQEGFVIQKVNKQIVITSPSSSGLLYGTFQFIRLLQTSSSIDDLKITSNPAIDVRILNHWDNLDRSSERGYAGFSIWDWHRLPEYLPARYRDYARANASIGINGTVLTNVNSNALILTKPYIEKTKALADLFRPYGIKVYLTARFSAPTEIGGLKTADPLNEEVQKWWNDKAAEVYKIIPNFGGFLVKANSEGQPGPQNYGRSHVDGANMLAKAVKQHGGIVIWRAFVYSEDEPDDRAKQAYTEFKPLDGQFEDNVLVQVKNGPIDFQPREPIHPLFGAMPKTPLMMEFQITQEYLGQATQLVYLAPMYKEVLDTDTYTKGKGSTVSKVIDGSLHDYKMTGIAGVANIGNDLNWTGHPMAQSNWFAFGRLSWNPQLSSENIAQEWVKSTYGNDTQVVSTITKVLMSSWEASINYMTPLGLHHLMGTGHHYGPAPWVDNLSRADWTPYYYHKSDANGIGFDRTKTGSNAVAQYSGELNRKYENLKSCPEKYILWFHHVPWDYEMKSGRTLWNELGFKYQSGINSVKNMQKDWHSLKSKIDSDLFAEVEQLLNIQLDEAKWWKNASMLYFQTYSKKDWPAMLEPAPKDLDHYKKLTFPYAPGIKPRW